MATLRLAALLAVALACAAPEAPPTRMAGTTLVLCPAVQAGAVTVAGDFNGWATPGAPTTRRGDGRSEAAVTLEPGVRQVTCAVSDGGEVRYLAPENADGRVEDGFGGANGVFYVQRNQPNP